MVTINNASYLESETSLPLKVLLLNSSSITAEDVAKLFHAMTSSQAQATSQRQLHVDVTGNHFSSIEPITIALSRNIGPSSLSMKQLDFQDESDFVGLLQAVRTSSRLRALGIGEALFPTEISKGASEELRAMLAENSALELLDLSGENSRIESSSMGAGLGNALLGLKDNSTLKALGIRDQSLGMQGATILADILASNSSLMAIHCERNQIPLAGVSLITQSLQHNTGVVRITGLDEGKELALSKIHGVARTLPASDGPSKSSNGIKSKFSKAQKDRISVPADLATARELVAEKWDVQLRKMHFFLDRNRRIAMGEAVEDESSSNGNTPPLLGLLDSASTEIEALDHVLFKTVEKALADVSITEGATLKTPPDESLIMERSWLDLS
jgi:hypothetical protein